MRQKPSLNFYCANNYKNWSHPHLKIFVYLRKDCEPIAAKSLKYSERVWEFIKIVKCCLTDANIIGPINSSWKSQVLVVWEKNKVKNGYWLFRDNKYIQFDAHPLPKIDELVKTITKYKVLQYYKTHFQYPIKFFNVKKKLMKRKNWNSCKKWEAHHEKEKYVYSTNLDFPGIPN